MLAVALHLLFNLKSDCHCNRLSFKQVAEPTPSETTEMLAASSPEAAQIDSEVTQIAADNINSISEADTETLCTGEEVLAEGLIPSDANGSLDDTLASQPAAAGDPAATSGIEPPLLADITEGGQAQNADPAAASTSQMTDDAQLDPNSTAALIQVSRSSLLLYTNTITEFAISGASMHCSLNLHRQHSTLLVQLIFNMDLRSTGLLHVRHCSMSLTCSIISYR